MSKRYVIQVNVGGTEDSGLNGQWENVQHPAGGDWLTRSRSTAIADAAKLVHAGETRELRIGVSKPVYEVTPVVDMEQILAVKTEINWTADIFADTDEDDDEDYDGTDEDEDENENEDDAPIAFELVDENTHEVTDDGSCCFKHRQAWIASQM